MRSAEGERKLGNLEAADAFAARVQELAEKYRIEPRIEEGADPLGGTDWYCSEIGGEAHSTWLLRLAAGIALAHRTRLMIFHEDPGRLQFVGINADADLSAALLTILGRALLHSQKKYRVWNWLNPHLLTEAAMNDYALGFAEAIYQRYARRQADLERKMNSHALVSLLEKRIDDYVSHLPRIELDPEETTTLAYFHGYDAGRGQAIEPGLLQPTKEKKDE